MTQWQRQIAVTDIDTPYDIQSGAVLFMYFPTRCLTHSLATNRARAEIIVPCSIRFSLPVYHGVN